MFITEKFLISLLRNTKRCLHTTKIAATKVKVNGLNLHYEVAGNGSTTALCLPGALGTTQSDFKPQLSGLASDEITLVAWDPPGYGKSRPPPRHYSTTFLNNDASIAAGLMKNLGYDKYSLLGWSDGGITSLILAAAFPERVDKLVVCGANAYVSEKDINIYKGIRDISTWSERMRAPLEAEYGKEYFKELWEGWVDALVAIHEEKGGDLCKSDIKNISCPTLIIHGAKDPVAPIEHAYYLHENIKGSELFVMNEGKHNVHLRYADEFNAMVAAFLLKKEA